MNGRTGGGRPGGGRPGAGRPRGGRPGGANAESSRIALRSGLTGGGLTAGFAIVWWAVCLILRGVDGLGVFVSNIAGLAWSILVLGALAAVCNYVVGFVRGRIHYPGVGVNAMGKTASGGTGAWAWTTAAFLAFTAPVVTYVVAAFWLNAAMTIAFCLLLVCAPAAVVFAVLARVTVRA